MDKNKDNYVYVRDEFYAWLPAEIQSSSKDGSCVVKIVLPDDWLDKTVLQTESCIKELENKMGSISNSNKLRKASSPPKFGKIASRRRSIEQSTSNRRLYNYDGGKMTNGINRTIHYEDYHNGELPVQNIGRSVYGKNTTASMSLMNAHDMADLYFLHEAAILYNLKLRHGRMMPYTRVGDIMVAVNPFQWIDGLYSRKNQALYGKYLIWDVKDEEEKLENSSKYRWELYGNDVLPSRKAHGRGSCFPNLGLEPHVFETAAMAYRGLIIEKQSQTILVSGESGAGKTETVKIIMTDLATMEEARKGNYSEESDVRQIGEGSQSIVRGVVESNPVFEAFGNAKTCRNDNSSRFGRFTQLHFDVEGVPNVTQNEEKSVPKCSLAGSTCATYLLEKSRVVSHVADERTFHIFYQLLAAPEKEKAAIWNGLVGHTSENFVHLSVGGIASMEERDIDAWKQTVKAMKLFGFEDDSFRDVMRALCIVLQLGNLKFEHPVASFVEEGGSTITSEGELDKLSSLMGISSDHLTDAMTARINEIRGEKVMVKLSPTDAKDGCDALAKEIYARIFDRLVRQINEYTSPSSGHNQVGSLENAYGSINLLDIFGFEMFAINRFEQMCINYVNERLQQKYIIDNFNAVREEYIEEELDMFEFTIADNFDVVSLFEGDKATKRLGLISILNEECMNPNGTDISFVHNLRKNIKNLPRLLADDLYERFEFGIKHFAGCVTYDANKFLQRNADHISNDLLNCACKSTNFLIASEFKELVALSEQGHVGTSGRRLMISNRSVISKFRLQLDRLTDIVKPTQTRYIRCIKPNGSMLSCVTDHWLTMHQLISAGLVTAANISRATFPNKLNYFVVWKRFHCLHLKNEKLDTPVLQSQHEENSTKALSLLSKDSDEMRINVEKMLSSLLMTPFTRIDGVRVPSFTCAKTRVYFRAGALERLEADLYDFVSTNALFVQTWYRCQTSRLKYLSFRKAMIILQNLNRGKADRSCFLRKKGAAVVIQAYSRRANALWNYLEIKRTTLIIQKWSRANAVLKQYLKLRHTVVIVQSARRRKVVRANFLKRKHAAITIQTKRRGMVACSNYIRIRNALIVLQQAKRRGKIAQAQFVARAKATRSKYLEMRCAAIAIQAWSRGKTSRLKYFKMKRAAARMKRAATVQRLSGTETFASAAAKKKSRSVSNIRQKNSERTDPNQRRAKSFFRRVVGSDNVTSPTSPVRRRRPLTSPRKVRSNNFDSLSKTEHGVSRVSARKFKSTTNVDSLSKSEHGRIASMPRTPSTKSLSTRKMDSSYNSDRLSRSENRKTEPMYKSSIQNKAKRILTQNFKSNIFNRFSKSERRRIEPEPTLLTPLRRRRKALTSSTGKFKSPSIDRMSKSEHGIKAASIRSIKSIDPLSKSDHGKIKPRLTSPTTPIRKKKKPVTTSIPNRLSKLEERARERRPMSPILSKVKRNSIRNFRPNHLLQKSEDKKTHSSRTTPKRRRKPIYSATGKYKPSSTVDRLSKSEHGIRITSMRKIKPVDRLSKSDHGKVDPKSSTTALRRKQKSLSTSNSTRFILFP